MIEEVGKASGKRKKAKVQTDVAASAGTSASPARPDTVKEEPAGAGASAGAAGDGVVVGAAAGDAYGGGGSSATPAVPALDSRKDDELRKDLRGQILEQQKELEPLELELALLRTKVIKCLELGVGCLPLNPHLVVACFGWARVRACAVDKVPVRCVCAPAACVGPRCPSST
jgi:hypothetical protein